MTYCSKFEGFSNFSTEKEFKIYFSVFPTMLWGCPVPQGLSWKKGQVYLSHLVLSGCMIT